MSIFPEFIRLRRATAIWRLLVALFLPGITAIATGNTIPGSVSLAWDRNPESDVAGYKIYWGSASRVYTQVRDTGNTAEATLSNLTPGVPYYCAVTAYNASGQESSLSDEITVSAAFTPGGPDSSSRLVLLEAEAGQMVSPLAAGSDGGVTYVSCPAFPVAGSTTLNFEIAVAAEYHVWCRVRGTAASSDSFFIALDDAVTDDVFHFYGAPEPLTGTRSSTWTWKKVLIPPPASPAPDASTVLEPRVYALAAGSHSLRFKARELHAQIDRVVLSADPDFVPTDELPRTGDALAITGTSGNLAVNVGDSATLEVTAAATGPVSYQWYKDGAVLPGANGPSLTLDDVEIAASGNYSISLASGSASATAGPIVLTVSQAFAPPPLFRVNRLTVNPDRSVAFDVEGELNTTVLIYASSDLTNWELIGGQVNSNGSLSVEDPAAVGAPQRFYRLVSEASAQQTTGDGAPDAVPQGSPTKELYVNPGL